MKMLILICITLIITINYTTGSEVLKEFAAGNNQFAADVYRELLKSNSGSFLVCPLSAEIVLALVAVGAGGQTAQQLSAGLHLPDDKEKVQETFKQLVPHLEGNENYTLSSANKVYVKDGVQIKPAFKKVAVETFAADIQNINFEKSDEAASEMNKWVEEKTHDKIKDLIKSDSLSEETQSILINAMYFHGKWIKAFDKDLTSKKSFYLNVKDQVVVDMMEQTDNLKYFENSELNAKFLELPYAGDDVTMTFVLPNDKQGLSALENQIADVLATSSYSFQIVHAVIPKFKIETSTNFKLILQELGIKDAFEDGADIKDILVDVPLKIDEVIQKAFIEVEEEGTTAAAATYVELVPQSSFSEEPLFPKQFIADHPFIFYLKIKDIVFFVGRYSSPSN